MFRKYLEKSPSGEDLEPTNIQDPRGGQDWEQRNIIQKSPHDRDACASQDKRHFYVQESEWSLERMSTNCPLKGEMAATQHFEAFKRVVCFHLSRGKVGKALTRGGVTAGEPQALIMTKFHRR